ncbi:hypothetical protein CCAX7_006600 [Capsulimonas corticalis]|uniref:Uncharacterized protein n=1 Tax=Capsulimonas corticalis TaxID=2219043 RepID=A0A402D1J3_9BACT|nr:FxSxx-COOH system tetratricopeptide repeat protein [Capsulimonas corticalis]BDI28609.1 hypothetical protein CCAX7_006600 [Capsulimonas corticalis]
MPTDNTACDVWIVCALAEEAEATTKVIAEQCGVQFTDDYAKQNNKRQYKWTIIKNDVGESLNVRVSWAPGAGPQEMGLHLQALLNEMPARFVGMTGICAGERDKTALGDLIVGERAFLYDQGKVVLNEHGQPVHKHDVETWGPNRDTLQYVRSFDGWKPLVAKLPRRPTRRQQRDWLIDWLLQNPTLSLNDIPDPEIDAHAPNVVQIAQKLPKIFTKKYQLTATYRKINRRFDPAYHDPKASKAHIVPVASGNAVRADNPFAQIQTPIRSAIALEMEGATFYRIVSKDFPGAHSLFVKGVCDYADPEKDDSYHHYAAEASALYMLSFIQKYVTEELMPRPTASHQDASQGETPPRLPADLPKDLPFFTGRDRFIEQIREALADTAGADPPLPIAITALGGEGKTSCAARYCHQYAQNYNAIFWIQAQSKTTLAEGYAAIASRMGLSAATEADQTLVIRAVKHWLESNHDWLMVLDNADDLTIVRDFIPSHYGGHILITSQESAVGDIAHAMELPKLSLEDSALLLLRRAKRISRNRPFDHATTEDKEAALSIAAEVECLPLALDQAGAYIEEAKISPAKYLTEFKSRAAELLKKNGKMSDQARKSVTITFSLAFEKVNTAHPLAGDLLRCCAFLAPSNIPESIFTQSKPEFGDLWLHAANPNFWDEIVSEARRYSLLTRDSENDTLSIHRLVQIVLRDAISETDRRNWANTAINAISYAFPSFEYEFWQSCDQMLPHALACIDRVNRYQIASYEAGILLMETASYLNERAQYVQAEQLYDSTIRILISSVGPEHPDTLSSIAGLAIIYVNQGRYNDAEPLYLQVKEIQERVLGKEHPDTLGSVHNLALLYDNQGRYEEAEPMYLQVTEIWERVLGKEHPDTLSSINNLANLYKNQGRYEEAEPMYLQVKEIRERVLGKEHPNTLSSINNLANLYSDRGRYEEAEPLYLLVKEIQERVLGKEHPDTLSSTNNLAGLYVNQGRYEEAEPLYLLAKEIRERVLGKEHPDTLSSINNLALLYSNQGRYEEAEPLYLRVVSGFEKKLGKNHPWTKIAVRGYVFVLRQLGRAAEADALEARFAD